jgi:hypothetical protein
MILNVPAIAKMHISARSSVKLLFEMPDIDVAAAWILEEMISLLKASLNRSLIFLEMPDIIGMAIPRWLAEYPAGF